MLFFAIVYTVEGIGQAKVGVIWQPLTHYLKESQDWTPVQIAASLAVLDVPWVVKPLYGMLSDFLPLFGYRRRSYLLLANVGAIAAFLWTTQALTPAPIVFALLLTSIAMAASSTVCGALLVENGQKHSASAAFINQQWLWFNVAVMVATFAWRRADRVPVTGRRTACRGRDCGCRADCDRRQLPVAGGRGARGHQHCRVPARAAGISRNVPIAHAVVGRRVPVLLLLQSRFRHAALFPHDRPPALLAGHDRPAVVGQRRRMGRGRIDLPLPAEHHGIARAAQPEHTGRHAIDPGIPRPCRRNESQSRSISSMALPA